MFWFQKSILIDNFGVYRLENEQTRTCSFKWVLWLIKFNNLINSDENQ